MLSIIVSGLCGALASISGKVSFSATTPFILYLNSFCEQYLSPFSLESYCWNVSYAVRLVAFFFMFYANAMALSTFLKALESKSSLTVTVVSSATNFLTTGLLSGLLLGEEVGKMWFLGALVIALGVFLIAMSQGGVKQRSG